MLKDHLVQTVLSEKSFCMCLMKNKTKNEQWKGFFKQEICLDLAEMNADRPHNSMGKMMQ